MTDFLNVLIERHTNAAPQIVPRLPSIYEPEVPVCGWGAAAPDDVPVMEEIHSAGPPVPMTGSETASTHIDAAHFQESAVPTPPVHSRTTAQPMREKAEPAPSLSTLVEEPALREILHEPEVSFSLRARATDTDLPQTWVDTQVGPVMAGIDRDPQEERRERTSLHHEAAFIEQLFVKKARAEKGRDSRKADFREPTNSAPTEKAVAARPTETAAADLTAPRTVTVRQVRQEGRAEPATPYPTATADDVQSFANNEPPAENEFPLPTQEGKDTREVKAAAPGRYYLPISKRARAPNHEGILAPSATSIAPAIPSVAGLETPVPRPEPVINVTIGRIEIRATMPPPQSAPKPQGRNMTMSLDEYLRRRSGSSDR